MSEENHELLTEIKRSLDVTYTHKDDDINDMIYEGIAFLQNRCGKLPFSKNEKTDLAYASRRLLKDYCRYAWSEATSEFERNYLDALLNLQITAALERRHRNGES